MMTEQHEVQCVRVAGPGPYGFRLNSSNDLLVVDKLRKRGKADECGLQEGDVLVAINDATCRGMSHSTAMQLIDADSDLLNLHIIRGSHDKMSVEAAFAELDSMPPNRLSTQEKLCQTLYVAKADPLANQTSTNAELMSRQSIETGPTRQPSTAGSSLTRPDDRRSDIRTRPQSQPPTKKTMFESDNDSDSADHMVWTTSSTTTTITPHGMTLTAPSGVQLQHNADQSITMTFGNLGMFPVGTPQTRVEESFQTSTTKQSFAVTKVNSPLSLPVWQPKNVPKFVPKKGNDEIDELVERTTEPLLPKLLSRILSADAGSDSDPSTPASPGAKTKKIFSDSAFYDDPQHRYPTFEEQIKLARKVALSVLSPANTNSRGHKMFVKRRERAIKWTTGVDDEENLASPDPDTPDEEKFFQSEPWKVKPGWEPNTGPSPVETKPPPLLSSVVFAPRLPSGHDVDVDRMNALSSEELERMRLLEKKSTHTSVSPQVCFSLADDLKNMKGKGGKLFAKRQAKSETWGTKDHGETGEEPSASTPPPADGKSEVLLKLSADHKPPADDNQPRRLQVNRLSDMPKPSMTPWDSVVEYGTVDKAFSHLDQHGTSTTPAQPSPTGPSRQLSKNVMENLQASLQKKDTNTGKTSPRATRPTSAIEPGTLREVGVSRETDIKSLGGDPNAAGLALAMASGLAARSTSDSGYRPVKFKVPSTGDDPSSSQRSLEGQGQPSRSPRSSASLQT